jgi:hypothetical protein
MKAPEALSTGLQRAPVWDLFRQNNICISAVVGSQYGATIGAAESLIAQLHSQGKLTTPRLENQKIRHENEILKANERLHKAWDLQLYRLIQKNICANLVRLSLYDVRMSFQLEARFLDPQEVGLHSAEFVGNSS